MACRDITKAERAAKEVIRESSNPNVVVKVVNLASMDSIRKFCKDINANEEHVDILINNAGEEKILPLSKSFDGYD